MGFLGSAVFWETGLFILIVGKVFQLDKRLEAIEILIEKAGHEEG